MITAEKNPFLDALLYVYLRGSLRRHFYAIDAMGMEHWRKLEAKTPVLAVANHTCWWDGLIIFFLTRFCRERAFYCMMAEKQLRHYPFFRWLGAFSVDQENSIRAAAAVHYACKLLRMKKTMMWIFPQGVQTSRYEDIEIKPGIEYLAKHSNGAVVLPVAFAYEFFREQKPQVLIRFGEPILNAEVSAERVQKSLQQLAQGVLEDCRTGDLKAYERLMKPSLSMNKRWEWFWLTIRGKGHLYVAENR
jgi:1-acyl-sn-glycerol-3-phosphate acyltransferase